MEMISCSNTDCAAVLYRYEMATHEEKCPHKTVRCINCKGKIKLVDVTQHQTYCPKMAIVCPNNCVEMLLRYTLTL